MRLIGNTKLGQNRPLTKLTHLGDYVFVDGTFKDYVISIIPKATPQLPEPTYELPIAPRHTTKHPRLTQRRPPASTDGKYNAQLMELLRNYGDTISTIRSYEGLNAKEQNSYYMYTTT